LLGNLGENVDNFSGGPRRVGQAGYNPEAAISVWEKMSKLEGSSSIAILSTHPTNQTRINAILYSKKFIVYFSDKSA